DHFLRGSALYFAFKKPDMVAAREEFRRAIEIDPHFAAAHARLSMAYTMDAAFDWSESPQESLEQGYRSACKAVALDDFDASAHAALAYVLSWTRRCEPAAEAACRAIDLNPNCYDAHFTLGIALCMGGRPHEAIPALESTLRLSPRDPLAWATFGIQALAQYGAGQYESAI